MKTYDIILTKSYLIKINADNKSEAKSFTEFFTGDIEDISTEEDKEKYSFSIKEIECATNETIDTNSFLR